MVQVAQKREARVVVKTATYHLHLEGRVQGVGFRPYVYNFARQNSLVGNVRNDTDGVHVIFNASGQNEAEQSASRLIRGAPSLSIIKRYEITEIDSIDFSDFKIAESRMASAARLMITPDLAMCDICRRELLDKSDRRFDYPFITCANCGPRYSILTDLPYDRPNTSMSKFEMCHECTHEYNDILDRRHYSQTNSCPECPVTMTMYDGNGQVVMRDNDKSIIEIAASHILKGDIIAIKGIGGYLLLADATNISAISELRRRKYRLRKPFAVMYPDVATLAGDVELADRVRGKLLSAESPIVLVPLKRKLTSGLATDGICPGLSKLGVMLPYTGVYELLLRQVSRPVVATSGNISDSPIIFEDTIAIKELGRLADLIISNDRPIRTPQDDSVVRYDPIHGKEIILRRSRGLAPGLCWNPADIYDGDVMAAGADLKSAFGIAVNGEMYVSQYLGNLECLGAQNSYTAAYENLAALLDFKPEFVIRDLHPGYFSSEIADEIAIRSQAKLLEVQHHVAHFCSVLGENKLLNSAEPVLGVVWDGTGYGIDGNIWGGEYFRFNCGEITRLAHHSYFSQMLGDKMSREPRLSAFALLVHDKRWREFLEPKFTPEELNVYKSLNEQGLYTSSTGRLFDAMASVLGLCDVMDYEGEAAILLEECATRHLVKHGDSSRAYQFGTNDAGDIDFQGMFDEILLDTEHGVEAGEIALCFHRTLVNVVEYVARSAGITSIAFSGGVFQNALLVGMCQSLKSKGYSIFFHNELSPNDENISHGQLVYALLKSRNPRLGFSK